MKGRRAPTSPSHMLAALAAVLMLLPVAQGLAGAITVTPIRVELSPRRPVATLDVRNDGDDAVTVQIERYDWTQPDGTDTYTSSTALVATPGVFELAPHGSQTLRVAFRDPQTPTTERAFRLYATEVPPDDSLGESGLHMALRIGIPIFVEPGSGSARLTSEIKLLENGKAALHVRNSGTRFTRTNTVDIQNAAGKSLLHITRPGYVLAGGEYVWLLEPDMFKPAAGDRYQLSIVTENGRERIDTLTGP